MLIKGDFHMHSTCSDGNLSPTELVRYAKKRKVDIISLTDHNDCDGLDEAINEGKRSDIVVIPGVELSTKYKENRVHILGYFKDDSYNNELFREVLKKVKGDKSGELRSIFGSAINFNGYKKKLYVESGIQLLKFFGASVVLAHPVLLSEECFFNIKNMDFDGIEARYFLNSDDDTEFYIKFAKEKGLYYTAGSDFHTRIEEYRIHGLIGDVFLNEEEIEDFLWQSGLDIWLKDLYK